MNSLGLMETVDAILDGLKDYTDIRTLKLKDVTPDGSKIEEKRTSLELSFLLPLIG